MIAPERSVVISNQRIAPNCYILTVQSPKLSKKAKPGQFTQLTFPGRIDPFLPRPFSFLDIADGKLKILYQSVGKGTVLMSELQKGDEVNLLGPFGNGWPKLSEIRDRKILLAGGGVGIPPVFHFAVDSKRKSGKSFTSNTTAFLGGRSKAFLHYRSEFRAAGIKVISATDDGSFGHKGTNVEALEDYIENQCDRGVHPSEFVILACGPNRMLEAVSDLAQKYDIRCWVSLEEHMPCGFGACQGCAVELNDATAENGSRYGLCCSEGPVFDSTQVIWESLP